MTPVATKPYPIILAALFIGVLAISSGAIFARLGQAIGIHSFALASWRLGFAALIFLPFIFYRGWHQFSAFNKHQYLTAWASGLLLACHFAVWISSLEYTSVASSTALVTTNPLWIGIAGFVLFSHRLQRLTILGITISLLGSILIFASDYQSSAQANTSLGNVLAILGSWFFSAYLLTGQRLRSSMALAPYCLLVYGSAAGFLFIFASLQNIPLFTFSFGAWQILLAIALLPQVLGHSAYNWAMPYVPAALIGIFTLGEPVLSSIIAFILFDESFRPLQLAGFCCLLLGIALAINGERASVLTTDSQ